MLTGRNSLRIYFEFLFLFLDFLIISGIWNVLKICIVGGQLMGEIKACYKEANACARVDGGPSFPIEVGLRQEYVMSPWLFNIFIDG